jgi:hypothetical protein
MEMLGGVDVALLASLAARWLSLAMLGRLRFARARRRVSPGRRREWPASGRCGTYQRLRTLPVAFSTDLTARSTV